jgi:hypothetical protein
MHYGMTPDPYWAMWHFGRRRSEVCGGQAGAAVELAGDDTPLRPVNFDHTQNSLICVNVPQVSRT